MAIVAALWLGFPLSFHRLQSIQAAVAARVRQLMDTVSEDKRSCLTRAIDDEVMEILGVKPTLASGIKRSTGQESSDICRC